MRLFCARIFLLTVAALVDLASSGCYDFKFKTYPYEVKCLNNDTYLRITCHNDTWVNYLVRLDLPSALSVGFIDCNFPKMISLQEIFQTMNVTVKDHVAIMGRYSGLHRENFQGLSIPHLQLSGGNLDNMPSELLYDVTNVKEFNIISGDLIRIPEAFFTDWAENIVTLQLFKNKLRKIARNDFIQLFNLGMLDLRNNVIDEIEPGAFDSLTQMHTMRLDNNRLYNLPSGIFHQLSSLTDVSMSNNLFDKLPQDLFETTVALTIFTLIENNGTLKAIPNGFFKNLVNLETVYIEGSQVESLPSDLFVGCYKLSRVSIQRNQLKNLPAELVADTRSLESLEIRNNRLDSLPSQWSENDMEGLQSLKHFDASGNNLTRIDVRLISRLKSAIVVNLSRNKLAFEGSNEIEYENPPSSMDGPNGTRIPDSQTIQQTDPDSSVKLKRIDLSHNKITKINTEVMSILKYSDSIDLSYNYISSINISEISSALDGRDINEAGKMTMSLRDNPLSCDCHLIDFVRFLADQNDNESGKIIIDDREYYGGIACASPAEMTGRPIFKIQPQEMSCSVETNIPGDACNGTCTCKEYPAKQVLSVDCSHKNLMQLPSTIDNEHIWSIELNMTGNKLQITPSSSGSYMRNVTSLDLSNNNINKVTMELFSPMLQNLKLNGNQISRLDSNVIEYLENNNSLQNITLQDNKWICGCETRDFFNFIQKTVTRYDFHEVKCNGDNRKLYQMTASEYCSSGSSVFVVCLFIILLIGCILGGLYYKYRPRIRTWSYTNPPL